MTVGLIASCLNRSMVPANRSVFDNGGLKDDPEGAQQLINSLLEGMDNDGVAPRSENSLVQVHNTVWERVAKGSPVGMRIDCSGYSAY